MGDSFIAYLVFGPWQLSKAKIKRTKAKAAVMRLADMVVEWKRLIDLAEKCENSALRAEIDEKITRLDTFGFEKFEDVEWAADYAECPDLLVDALFEVWVGCEDSIDRGDPRDNKRKVLCAGDSTWGDEPDGKTYQTLKRADQAGLFVIYGIE